MAVFLFELIFIVIIIRVVKNAYKKGGNQRTNNNTQNGYYRPDIRGVRSSVNTYQNPSQNSTYTKKSTTQQIKANTQASKQTKTVQAVVEQDGPEEDQSTMDYLNQKAMEDKKEHAREKLEEKKRLNEKYGGLLPAMRYLPGDRVPRGMRVVYCPYCRAENLVETMGTQRCCYFCRTKL